MYKQSAAHRHEQANSSTLTTKQTQAITVATDENSTCPSSPRKPSANASNELLATGTGTASYIAPARQPRTEVQMELSFSRKLRQLEREQQQRGNQDNSPDILATLESESSSAFASGEGAYWAGLPEELAELTVGTTEALRRVVREGMRRRVVRR